METPAQKPAVTPENIAHFKSAHDLYATIAYQYRHQFQFRHEEFEGVQKIIGFCEANANAILADIHKLEPPALKEEAKPYVMDLTHVKGEEPKTETNLQVVP